MQHYLAIDQGTSGTKAIVVDEVGRLVSIAEVGVRAEYLPGGGVEQDPEALYDSVVSAGRQALAQAGVGVSAVAIANQGETVLAWDRDTGNPLTPAVVWQDRRAESICAGLSASAEAVAQRTGLVLDPYFSAPKMSWIRANLTTAGVVTTTDTWLVHRLCGAFVTDASTASRSLLLGLDSVEWDEELLELFGLADEQLPEIVGSDEIVGSTDAFGPSIPVAGLIVDQQAALLAESCLTPGDAKCTFGTGAFLLAQLGGNPARSTTGLTTSVAWRLRGRTSYCVDGQVYTAASAVRWAVDLGLVPAADQIDTVAADSSDGVLCVPALAGLAAPWWDSAATASFSGMTLSSGRGQLVRALLEGIAAQVAALADLVATDLGQPLTRLRVDGGLTQSAVLMQAQADLARIPVDVYPSQHATALGAATCARLALDPDADTMEAISDWTPQHTYEPVWTDDRAAEYLSRWQRAAESVLAQRETTST
ncbi:carbohydrate kinase [Mycolicibacterium moriokaense]|jgi:glycerol kinase|uniref:ATP:glycerol 3-phosphotransferase n=1 Tax=Mycolicibacterium moriokaense TaxID=39691 RepID=A0AAD1HBE6_9MYCO|nr:FGGY family carbohydrate kinase [Mycolicibacterium moriokaense]MCV7039837.1 carbohydrate kinase [Mycolicibacterium moriokaense]ORB25684.1 carbohydrate kinase [Mycolicibacterium moriokaense]BBX01715.1 carbohydrate kinase [Mycolicibacterium moriokaense]